MTSSKALVVAVSVGDELAVAGGGKLSLDHLFGRLFGQARRERAKASSLAAAS